jgi:hypothetical protein
MKKCGSRSYGTSRSSRPYGGSRSGGGGRSSRPSPAYTYQVNLRHGKKYIGMAHTKASLKRRIDAQLSQARTASSVCRNLQPLSVSHVWKHPSVQAAKQAETNRYYSAKAILGKDKVRGAGHTRAF